MNNRFRVEVIKKDLPSEDDRACSALISSLKEKTKLININEQLYGCDLNDNDAVIYTVHFANQLKKHSRFFEKVRCFDLVSGEEKIFV